MHVDAAQRQIAKRKGKGGKKGGDKSCKKGRYKKKRGKGGAAAEEVDPAAVAAAAADPNAGEDTWTGEGVEFETIDVNESSVPIEADE